MAYNVSDALREMAEQFKKPTAPDKYPLEKKPVDAFDAMMIPESFVANQPKLIGSFTASYLSDELAKKFNGEPEFPENPFNADCYAWWSAVDVTVTAAHKDDEYADDETASLEVVFCDKYGDQVGKLYRGQSVEWQVYAPSWVDAEQIDQARADFERKYGFKIKP